jgi:putative acetyltransferase
MSRPERAGDRAAVRLLYLDCFPTPAEADLVDRLRDHGDAVLSLVVEVDGQVAGHVMFSRMVAPSQALGLGPVAVLPAFRRRGLAADLITAGLNEAAIQGWTLVFVLGAPDYYGRFGFSTARAADFLSPYAGGHFMACALGGAETGGRAEYAPAFADLA